MDKNNFKIGELLRDEFNEKQLDEIMIGILSGIDVSKIAKSYYHHAQIRELRIGLEHGLDITCYSDRFLHSKDMAIIRKAMEQGFDVELLLNRDLNFKQREQIYLGMVSGICYQSYSSSVYNEWKMLEVRVGLEEGFDLTSYLNTHNHNQIHQIRVGYEKKLDVHIFDDPRFKQAQMAEIIDGLLQGLEVSQYADYNLSIEQMRAKKADLKRENVLIKQQSRKGERLNDKRRF